MSADWSVATDRPDTESYAALRKDADPAVRSKLARSAVDWARSSPSAVLAEWKLAPGAREHATARLSVARAPRYAAARLSSGACVATAIADAMFNEEAIACIPAGTAMAVSLARASRARGESLRGGDEDYRAVGYGPGPAARPRRGGLPEAGDTRDGGRRAKPSAGRRMRSRTRCAKQRDAGNWLASAQPTIADQDGDFPERDEPARSPCTGCGPPRPKFEDRIRARAVAGKQRTLTTGTRMQLSGGWAARTQPSARRAARAHRGANGWTEAGRDGALKMMPMRPAISVRAQQMGVDGPIRVARGRRVLLRTQKAEARGSWPAGDESQPYFERDSRTSRQWISSRPRLGGDGVEASAHRHSQGSASR